MITQPFISDEERKGLLYGSLIAAGLRAASGESIGDAILRGFSGLGSAYSAGLDSLYAEKKAQLDQQRIQELIKHEEEKRKQLQEFRKVLSDYFNEPVNQKSPAPINKPVDFNGGPFNLNFFTDLTGKPSNINLDTSMQKFTIPSQPLTRGETLTPEQRLLYRTLMATGGNVPPGLLYLLPKEEEPRFTHIGGGYILNQKTGDIFGIPTERQKPNIVGVFDTKTKEVRAVDINSEKLKQTEIPISYWPFVREMQQKETASTGQKKDQREAEKKVNIIMRGTETSLKAWGEKWKALLGDSFMGVDNLPPQAIDELKEILKKADDKIELIGGFRPYGTDKNPPPPKTSPVTKEQAIQELIKRGKWPVR